MLGLAFSDSMCIFYGYCSTRMDLDADSNVQFDLVCIGGVNLVVEDHVGKCTSITLCSLLFLFLSQYGS